MEKREWQQVLVTENGDQQGDSIKGLDVAIKMGPTNKDGEQ